MEVELVTGRRAGTRQRITLVSFSHFRQTLGGIAEFLQLHATLVHHREEQAAHLAVGFAAVVEHSARFQYGEGMPKEVKNRIRDHMIGQWTAQATWGDDKSEGEHRIRWSSGRSCVIEQITFSDKDGKAQQTNLWGWDLATKSIMIYGFTSRGDQFVMQFNDLSNDKWTGHGKGTFQGKEWKSPASVELTKDSIKYEDTTEGKPYVLVLKRKPKK